MVTLPWSPQLVQCFDYLIIVCLNVINLLLIWLIILSFFSYISENRIAIHIFGDNVYYYGYNT